MNRRAWVFFLAMIAVTAAFDQGSKVWARGLPTSPADCGVAHLIAGSCHGVPQPVIAGYWDWELAENPGAAFSTLIGGAGARVLLSLIACAALIALGVAASRTGAGEGAKRLGYALIAGGALGNLIDRLRDGAVTDFVRWRIHDHMWPIFNVADAALLVGVAVLVLESTLAKRRTSPSPA